MTLQSDSESSAPRASRSSEDVALRAMVDSAPFAMMQVDRDLVVTYANPASLKLLERVEEHLPIRAADIVGTCIDVFHARPEHQRRILGDAANLPHEATIQLGPERLSLRISPVFDAAGEHIGASLAWDLVTEKLRLKEEREARARQDAEDAETAARRVASLLEVVEAAADGDLARSIDVRGDDPLGQMGDGLERLLRGLRTRMNDVRSAAQAEADVSGVYRFLAKLVTPSGAAVRMTRGIAMFVNFAEVRPRDRTATRLELELEGIPRQLVFPWFREVLTGYAEGLTQHVRASELEATLEPLDVMGTKDGVDLLRALLIMDYR